MPPFTLLSNHAKPFVVLVVAYFLTSLRHFTVAHR